MRSSLLIMVLSAFYLTGCSVITNIRRAKAIEPGKIELNLNTDFQESAPIINTPGVRIGLHNGVDFGFKFFGFSISGGKLISASADLKFDLLSFSSNFGLALDPGISLFHIGSSDGDSLSLVFYEGNVIGEYIFGENVSVVGNAGFKYVYLSGTFFDEVPKGLWAPDPLYQLGFGVILFPKGTLSLMFGAGYVGILSDDSEDTIFDNLFYEVGVAVRP